MAYSFFVWCQQLPIGAAIRDSLWLFPVVETFHLLALSVLGGVVLLVDLRLLGLGLTRQPLSKLARDVEPWLRGSLGVMLLSGFLLFSSEALKCYDNPAFWVKMMFLALAIVFAFSVRRRVTLRDEVVSNPAISRLVAITSLGLWTGVGIGGRAIGFY